MSAQTRSQREVDRLWTSSVGEDLSFLLARANAISLSAANAALAEHGLKVRSYSVLSVAADGLEPSQRELAEFLRLDPSQIVALVDRLEERGLVRREPDPTDRRNNVVMATDAGVAVRDAARAAARSAEEDLLAHLDRPALDALRSALQRLAGG